MKFINRKTYINRTLGRAILEQSSEAFDRNKQGTKLKAPRQGEMWTKHSAKEELNSNTTSSVLDRNIMQRCFSITQSKALSRYPYSHSKRYLRMWWPTEATVHSYPRTTLYDTNLLFHSIALYFIVLYTST